MTQPKKSFLYLYFFSAEGVFVDFKKKCMVANEYRKNLYRPSGEGDFTFELIDPPPFDVKEIDAMKISVLGTFVDIQSRRRRKFMFRNFPFIEK